MADTRRVRAELRATRIARTAPVGAAGARRSSSPVVNAATSPEAQEQQGSSQPPDEHVNGRTAMPSLDRPSGSASRTRPEMPHGRRALAMATELLRYWPAPDCHDEWLHRIEDLIAAARGSAALSFSVRPSHPQQTTRSKMRRPRLRGVSRTPSPSRKRDPALGLVNPG
ncbi:hypothetical protein D1007_40552 [Hordeum vulgare]|nr:hypothetical protein D1007_40552 [Hordeum vulgare]